MNSIMHSNNNISNNNNDDISDNPMHHVGNVSLSASTNNRNKSCKALALQLRVVMYAQCRHDHAIVYASDYKT